jgi:ribosomal protein S27E
MKVIRSVQDARGNIIQKQPEGGVGRTRCMKCQNLCTMQSLPDGTQVMRCGACGANYQHQSFDQAKATVAGVVPTRRPK